MKILKSILFILLTTIFFSCDPASFAIITNESKQDVKIKLYFNKNIKDSNGGFKSNLTNNDFKIIETDSLKHTATIYLTQKDTFVVSGGLRKLPNYSKYRKIEITKPKNISIVIEKNEMSKKFKKINNYLFEYKITD
jgi:hypothetical protein